MEMLSFQERALKKYSVQETFLLDDTEYIIQQIEADKGEKAAELVKSGLGFHERYIFVEINLKATAKARNQINNALPDILLKLSHEYTADLYELACESFETDRRFHLEQQFDQNRAAEVKKTYIDWCREHDMPVFTARSGHELLGYIIIDMNPGREKGCFQIMLGVTRPGIKGKMVAYPLYNTLLNTMELPENGGYTKYCGYISSANIASLNLHQHLGARFVSVVDEYIYRTRRDKVNEQTLTEYLIDKILHELPGQVFSVKKVRKEWTGEEKQRFEQELQYLTEKYSIDEIVKGYVFYTNSVMEEARYFKEHEDYRCHSFEEVDNYIYSDPERMKLYMLGLAIAEYLWMTVLKIHRFYAELIQNVSGNHYLEIGPGHGKYFLEAYNHQNFQRYDAVDVSETAIVMTRDYMNRYRRRGGVKYQLICRDATDLSAVEEYDFIVVQEVLEHIEDPEGMLRSIHRMLTPEGRVYALFPINAPSPAHIFLFYSIDHVKETVSKAGFEIVKEEYIVANGVTSEQAAEKKLPIDACLVLRKK